MQVMCAAKSDFASISRHVFAGTDEVGRAHIGLFCRGRHEVADFRRSARAAAEFSCSTCRGERQRPLPLPLAPS